MKILYGAGFFVFAWVAIDAIGFGLGIWSTLHSNAGMIGGAALVAMAYNLGRIAE